MTVHHSGRWSGLVCWVFSQSCVVANALSAGGVFLFPLFVPALKEHYAPTQSELSTIALAGMMGQYAFAAGWGILVDRVGPHACSLAASVLFSFSYCTFSYLLSHSLGSPSILAALFFISGCGRVASYFSAIFASRSRKKSGLATSVPLALSGISPLVLSYIAGLEVFQTKEGLDVPKFLLWMGLGSGFINAIGAIGLKHVDDPRQGETQPLLGDHDHDAIKAGCVVPSKQADSVSSLVRDAGFWTGGDYRNGGDGDFEYGIDRDGFFRSGTERGGGPDPVVVDGGDVGAVGRPGVGGCSKSAGGCVWYEEGCESDGVSGGVLCGAGGWVCVYCVGGDAGERAVGAVGRDRDGLWGVLGSVAEHYERYLGGTESRAKLWDLVVRAVGGNTDIHIRRGGEHGPPPSSSRYRQSQRSKGVGSSSTKVVLDGERGYDSEMAQTAPTQMPSGYHTDQSKRSSKDLYRAALDPRRNGARLSSMPSAPSYNYGYSDDVRQDDESEQNSSLRRVKKDRRHRDQYDAVPASVWMPQVQAEPKPSRSHRRESRSRRDDEIQHDPRTDKYYYRNAPDYYRNDYAPSPLLSSTPRYQYVIDDRAGMASPPPVEVPHAFPSEAYDHYATGTPLLQPPRSVSQLRAEGLIPASPANRRHRTTRSEDVTGGMFADGTEHRPLRHQPSRSEDLRKLGHGTAPPVPAPPEEHVPLARPVHVGRSASETTVPQLPQPATPGMYSSGLAVTPARPGYVMHPQLQESFAESANASRAPVNAAMASAAIASGTTDSDSSRERRRRTRRSKQVDASPLVGDPQLPKEPTPPPVVTAGKRARTTSGRSAVVLVGEEREEDTVVYPAESSRAVESSRAPVEPSRAAEPPRAPDALRAVKDAQPIGLAIFGSMTMPTTASGIMHGGIPHVSTFVGAGPRAIGHEVSRDGLDSSRQAPINAETPRQAEPQAAPRRGSVLDIMAEERTRKPSNSGTEERMRGLDRLGAEDHRRPSLEKGRTDPPLEKSRELPLEKGRVEGLERERGRLESIERGRKESLERSRVDQSFEKSKMDQSFERSRMDQSFEKSRRGSDASLDSFQSAELAASTTAPDFMSAREAMSPMSNYQSIAPSVRSAVNEARALATEARGMVDHAGPATVVMQGKEVHLGKATIDPRSGVAVVDSLSRATIMEPHSVKAATVGHRPKERKPEPESHSRPRIPSNNMLAAEPTVHRATVDVHTRDQVPAQVIVDEEGRMTRGPAPAARATRSSFSMQRPPPQTTTPATSPPQTHPIAIPPQTHPSTSPPQTHPATTSPPQAHPAVNSPPQTHPAVTSPHPPVTSPAHVEASALPRNLQQPQTIGSSKESLVDSTHVKAHKSKSSRWFWPKSKQAEPIPKAPSPTPPQAPSASASQPRVRQTSILGGLMGHPSSKSKSKTPEPQQEMYASQDSTPSSVTLDLEPKKDESRMPRMFASIKNSLRRTPSSAKLGHGMSRSMSRLPGTTPAPPPGAPLARSASTNGHNVGSPMRTKEPLKPAPPVPIETAPKDSASIPPPPMSAPIVMSTAPVTAPVPAPPLSAPVLPPVAPKPVPIRDDRRPPPKDVPIIEKARTPVPNASRASIDQSTATKVTRTLVDAHGRIVDSSGRPIDASGRPIDSVGRSDKRSSTQAPPHPRAASPPLVTRPVTATRIPANQTNIFTGSQTPRAPAQPVPVPHSSSRAQGSRLGRSSRDHAQPVASSSRPSRSREPMPVPIVEPSLPAPAAELGLPTPDATPRASPTGEEVFENRAAAIQREKERERERSRERRVVVPQPDLGAVNSKLKAQADHPTGGTLKFVHRQKRAVSIASLEAVTGQEAHFRSEASSIRTVTPGPGQTSFPNRDPHEATEDWRLLQLQEDMRLNAGKLQARRESVEARGVLKKRERGGLRKAGVAFDFPGPVINEDVEDQFDAMKKADIEMTYELERRKKRYK